MKVELLTKSRWVYDNGLLKMFSQSLVYWGTAYCSESLGMSVSASISQVPSPKYVLLKGFQAAVLHTLAKCCGVHYSNLRFETNIDSRH